MGWLFAVALGLQQGSGAAVWRSLGPLAAGHAIAVGLTVMVALALGTVIPGTVLDWIVAALLLGFGLYRILVNRHPRFGGMRVGPRDLTLWSLLMASAHGAGLMVVPLLSKSVPAGGAHPHHSSPVLQAALLDGQLLQGILAAAIHTAGYLIVTGAIAAVVYYKVGLRLLRTAWINLDLIWAGALITTALVILL
jgi:hypothetical protein